MSELYKYSLAIVGADQVNGERSLLRELYSLAVNTLYLAYIVFDLVFHGLQEYCIDNRLTCTGVKTDFYIFYVGRSAGCNAKVGKSHYSRVFHVLFSRLGGLLDDKVVGYGTKSCVFFLSRKSSLYESGLLLSFG